MLSLIPKFQLSLPLTVWHAVGSSLYCEDKHLWVYLSSDRQTRLGKQERWAAVQSQFERLMLRIAADIKAAVWGSSWLRGGIRGLSRTLCNKVDISGLDFRWTWSECGSQRGTAHRHILWYIKRLSSPVASSSLIVCETLIDNDSNWRDYHCSHCLLSLSHTHTHFFIPVKAATVSNTSAQIHKLVLATGVIGSACMQLLSDLIQREGTRPEQTQPSLREAAFHPWWGGEKNEYHFTHKIQ